MLIMESRLAKETIKVIKTFQMIYCNQSREKTEWPKWLDEEVDNNTFDKILYDLPILCKEKKIIPVFLIDNLDRVEVSLLIAGYLIGMAISEQNGFAVLSMRPETRDYVSKYLEHYVVHATIDLRSHGVENEVRMLRDILNRRLTEVHESIHDRKDRIAAQIIEELESDILKDEQIERLRILTNRNRRYLLEAMSFLLRYAPVAEPPTAVNPGGEILADLYERGC